MKHFGFTRTAAHLALFTAPLFAMLSAPVHAAAPPACNWVNSAENQGVHYGDVDLDASYYGALIITPTTATHLRIEGKYPAARNFSLTAYKGIESGAAVDALTDYQIQPDSGSQSPLIDIVHIDPTIAAGGKYTVEIVLATKPSSPAANTLYLDPTVLKGRSSVLVYRIYNPFSGISDPATGGVGLPTIIAETSSGDVPISTTTSSFCKAWKQVVVAGGPSIIKTLSELNLIRYVPRSNPTFTLFKPPSNSVPLSTINVDNEYMAMVIKNSLADLVLIRGRAPLYTMQPGVEPQVRHWSVCENNMVGLTYGCAEDDSVAIDSDGFYNIVVSVPKKEPANATHAYGFDWITYGTNPTPAEGVVIYRQQLASPDFLQSMEAAILSSDSASSVMGDYYPQATYCSRTVFGAQTSAHASPADVFAACKAGQ